MPSKLDYEREGRFEQYTALLERVDYVEKLLYDSVGKHAQWEEINVECDKRVNDLESSLQVLLRRTQHGYESIRDRASSMQHCRND